MTTTMAVGITATVVIRGVNNSKAVVHGDDDDCTTTNHDALTKRWCLTTGNGAKDDTSRQNMFIRLDENVVEQLTDTALKDERRTCYMYVGNTKKFSIQNEYWNIYAQIQTEQQQQSLSSSATTSSTSSSTLFSILFGDSSTNNAVVCCEDEKTFKPKARAQFLPLEINTIFQNVSGTTTTITVVSYGSYNGGLFLSQTTMTGTSTGNDHNIVMDVPPSLLPSCKIETAKKEAGPVAKEVQIRALPYVKNATSISLEPLTFQDWEWLELFAMELEQGALLQQISIVYPHQIFSIRIESHYIKETAWVKVLLDDSFLYHDSDEDSEKEGPMSLSDEESDSRVSDDDADDRDDASRYFSDSMESSSLDSFNDDFSSSSSSSSACIDVLDNKDESNNNEKDNNRRRQCVEDESDGAANEENDATADHDGTSKTDDDDDEYKVWEWRQTTSTTKDRRRRLCRKRRKYHKCLRLVADTEVIVTPKPRQLNKKETVKERISTGEGDVSPPDGWSLPLNVIPPHEVSYLSELTWYERWLCDDMLQFVTNKIEKRRSSNKGDVDMIALRSIADQMNYRKYCFNDTMVDQMSLNMTQKTFCCADTGGSTSSGTAADKKNRDEGIINISSSRVDTTTNTCPHCGKPKRYTHTRESAPTHIVWMSRSTFDQCFGSCSSTSKLRIATGNQMDDSSMRRQWPLPAKVRLCPKTNKNETITNNKDDDDMESIDAFCVIVSIDDDDEQLLYDDRDTTNYHHCLVKKKKKNSLIVDETRSSVVLSPSLYRALFAKQATTTRDDDACTSMIQIQLLLLNKDQNGDDETEGGLCSSSSPLHSSSLEQQLVKESSLFCTNNLVLMKYERTILFNVLQWTCSSWRAIPLTNQYPFSAPRRRRRRKLNIKRSTTAADVGRLGSGKRRTVVPQVQCMLLGGQEGTGKTYMCNTIAAMLKCTNHLTRFKYVDCQRLQTSYKASKGGMTFLLDELSRIFDTITSGGNENKSSDTTTTTQRNRLYFIVLDDLDVLIPKVDTEQSTSESSTTSTSHQQGQISPQLIHQTKLLANHLRYLIQSTRRKVVSIHFLSSVIILATVKSTNIQRPSLHKSLIHSELFDHFVGTLPSTLSSLQTKQQVLRRMMLLPTLEDHTTNISTTSATTSTITMMIDTLLNLIDPELLERSTEGYRSKDLNHLATKLLQEMQQQQQQQTMASTVTSSSAEKEQFCLNRHQVTKIWNRAIEVMPPIISSTPSMSGGASNELSSSTNTGTLIRPTGTNSMTLDTHVGGLFALKQELLECIEHPLKYSLLYQKSPINLPKGFMLFGPSGCGKTLIVKALANQLSLPLLLVKGPELFSKYIGQSEGNVRRVFERVYQVAATSASHSGAILCLDELDALAPKRGTDNTGVTDRVVNQLLTFLDGVETNFVHSSDDNNDVDPSDDDDETEGNDAADKDSNDDINDIEPKNEKATFSTKEKPRSKPKKPKQNVYIIGVTSRPDKVDAALLRPGRLEKHLFVGPPGLSKEEHMDVFFKLLMQRITLSSSVDDDDDDNNSSTTTASHPSVIVELDEETQCLIENGTFLSHLLFEQDSNLNSFTPADYKAAIDSAYLHAIHVQYLLPNKESNKDSSSSLETKQNDNDSTHLILTKQLLIDALQHTKPSNKSVTEEEQKYLERVYNQFRGIVKNSSNNDDNKSNDHRRRRLPEGTFL